MMDKFTYVLYVKKLDDNSTSMAVVSNIIATAVNEMEVSEYTSLYAFKLFCKANRVLPNTRLDGHAISILDQNYLTKTFRKTLSHLLYTSTTHTEILNVLEYLPVLDKIEDTIVDIIDTSSCLKYIEDESRKGYAYALFEIEDAKKYIEHIKPRKIIYLATSKYVIVKLHKPPRYTYTTN